MASSLIFEQTEQELTKKELYINNMRENYPRISFSLNPLCCL